MTIREIQSQYQRMDPDADRARILAELTGSEKKDIEEMFNIPAPKPKDYTQWYEQGMTDTKIAHIVNGNANNIYLWRKKLGLPSNSRMIDYSRFMAFYQQGMNDQEMARPLGCSTVAVLRWRHKNGLPALANRGRNRPLRFLGEVV